MDTWLRGYIIVLYAVQKSRKAPERISFDGIQDILWEEGGIKLFWIRILFIYMGKQQRAMKNSDNGKLANVCRKKNLKERSHEIVYPLNVSARWVAYGPNIKYPLETLLAGASEKSMVDKKCRVRAAWMPASIDVRLVASVEHLSQFDAKFADQRLGGLEQRRAQPARDTLLVCEQA